MNRLRQTHDVKGTNVTGQSYSFYYNRWNGPSLVTPVSIYGGSAQSVFDCNFPIKAKDALGDKKPKRYSTAWDLLRAHKLMGVPQLNEVQMSKLDLWSPGEQLVFYEQKAATSKMIAQGPNFGCLPLKPYLDGIQPPPSVSFTVVDDKVASYLLQRAYSKMSSAEYDFGVTVGEVAETAAMLAGPLRSIAKISTLAFAGIKGIYRDGHRVAIAVAKSATSRQIRRLKAVTLKHPFNPSLRVLDETANHWLAYKFGVLPFIDDVAKVMDFKENSITRLTGMRTAKVKGPKTDETRSLQAVRQYYYGQWYVTYFVVKRSIDRHYSGIYFRDKINAPLVNFAESIGFAPWQLPSLAYELIPLSFVVDRFIDIKSFVRGNLGSLSKDTFGSFCTRKISTTWSCTMDELFYGATSSDFRVKASQPLVGCCTYDQMHRKVNTARPLFPVVNPYWRQQLTADMTNLSLIWGRLRTHVGKIGD